MIPNCVWRVFSGAWWGYTVIAFSVMSENVWTLCWSCSRINLNGNNKKQQQHDEHKFTMARYTDNHSKRTGFFTAVAYSNKYCDARIDKHRQKNGEE